MQQWLTDTKFIRKAFESIKNILGTHSELTGQLKEGALPLVALKMFNGRYVIFG